MDVARALGYVSDDPEASTKVGVGALILAVPVLNIAAVGYEVEAARRVSRGDPRPLVEWSDPTELLQRGLGLALARVVYGAPAVFLFLAPILVTLLLLEPPAAPPAGSAPMLPPEYWPSLLLAGATGLALWLLYGLAYSLLAPAITVQFARHGRFGACFDWRAMLGLIRRNRAAYLKAWAGDVGVSLGASLAVWLASLLLGVVPCLGRPIVFGLVFGVQFVLRLMDAHLAGQLMQADAARAAAEAHGQSSVA